MLSKLWAIICDIFYVVAGIILIIICTPLVIAGIAVVSAVAIVVLVILLVAVIIAEIFN